jgi:signal recognition particle receptor subunit beta
MAYNKIVFTGTVGSGKTEAVQTLSDIPIIRTDVIPTDDVKDFKESTTLAMDYGELHMDNDEILALYGTPGQKRFSYMWDILARDTMGIVVLVDNSRKDPIEDLCIYVSNFKQHIDNSTVVFGITHLDLFQDPLYEMKKYYDFFQGQNYAFPIFPVDARKRSNVIVLVESLLAMLEIG